MKYQMTMPAGKVANTEIGLDDPTTYRAGEVNRQLTANVTSAVDKSCVLRKGKIDVSLDDSFLDDQKTLKVKI